MGKLNNVYQQMKAVGKDMRKEDIIKERRCIPIAQAILRELVEKDVSFDEHNTETMLKEYTPLVEKILPLLTQNNLLITDLVYIKKLVDEVTGYMFQIIDISIDQHMKDAQKIFWGCSERDITIAQLDKVLEKEFINKQLAEGEGKEKGG